MTLRDILNKRDNVERVPTMPRDFFDFDALLKPDMPEYRDKYGSREFYIYRSRAFDGLVVATRQKIYKPKMLIIEVPTWTVFARDSRPLVDLLGGYCNRIREYKSGLVKVL